MRRPVFLLQLLLCHWFPENQNCFFTTEDTEDTEDCGNKDKKKRNLLYAILRALRVLRGKITLFRLWQAPW
jgi:hypothetical protein